MSDDRTYAAAGVSLATAEGIVERLRKAVESTGRARLRRVRRPAPARRPAAARGLDRLDRDEADRSPAPRGALRACGADMAAHCINDVITCGADPLILLDYVAANRVELEQVAELVEGAAEVCRAAGVALIGGETAELPGVYREGELDFAATCVGVVDRDRVIDGSAVGDGDYVLGLPSAACTRTASRSSAPCSRSRTTTGPTSSRRRASTSTTCAGCATGAHAFAHVTGGGIEGNLSRVLPDGLRAEIDWDAWERPPVFEWLGRHVAEEEARRVFNLGIGYCAVVAEPGTSS